MPKIKRPPAGSEIPAQSPAGPWPAAADRFSVGGITYHCKWILCGKRSCKRWHGPYWYAFWKADRRVKSRYIGKRLPVAVVRARRRRQAGGA